MIPYGRHLIEDDDIAAVEKALKSFHLTGGPIIEEFEEALAAYCGRKYAVVVNSGTAALYCMYRSVPWALLHIPALTFAATATAAASLIAHESYESGQRRLIRFVDSIPDEDKTGEHRYVHVDFAGLPSATGCDFLDAAHSLGAKIGGQPATTRGIAAALSFHPCKTITTGEGGAVVTDNADIWQSVKELRDHGRNDGQILRLSGNFRMPAINAALGLSQLKKADRFVACRNEIAQRYLEEFRSFPFGLPPVASRGDTHAWHLFVLKVEPKRRVEFRDRLLALGVGTQVHYRPVYKHPVFARGNHYCEQAERAALTNVSIPIFSGMTNDDVRTVVDAVKEASTCLKDCV